MSTALVLMAHGSRHAAANDDLTDLADKIRVLGRYAPVIASYLELAEPNIGTACRTCVEQGATRIVMAPYFLSAGVHVHRDLAKLRDDLSREYPNVQFLLAEPLGRHPSLMQIVLERVAEAGG